MTRMVLDGLDLVLFEDGRAELGTPPRPTTLALLLGWPEEFVGHALPRDVRDALVARLGPTGDSCKACGGVVVRREVVKSVHPASGDGYGMVQTRCLHCSASDEWPFSDN
jgi:hypothetical protein